MPNTTSAVPAVVRPVFPSCGPPFVDLTGTLLSGKLLDIRNIELRGDLLRRDAAHPGKVEQIADLFRTGRNRLVRLLRLPCLLLPVAAVKFGFDRLPHEA